jgi:ADP-ribose pyrophosphatase YjhB (NUDIX family)
MSTSNTKHCPNCGQIIEIYKNPALTVDVIIESGCPDDKEFILIERKNPPYGWALPGGFVDYGESTETAARREAREETGLDIVIVGLLGVYSRPDRDPRGHTVSVVYVVRGEGEAMAGDDAAGLARFNAENLPSDIVFDHKEIITDYLNYGNRA